MSFSENSTTPSDAICAVIKKLSAEIGKAVYGHERTIQLLAGAFLIGGHVLLEGPPGIAKTLMARTFANAMGLRFNRIQFTPDLMPSDVTGVYIFDQKSAAFRFAAGPLFADIVLADEINRTPPKTQSALLEAMEERFITIDGKRHGLGELFFVIATQNPIEHEGTFPLPEAQLDRFLFKLHVGYPGRGFEEQMIQRFSGELPDRMKSGAAEQHEAGILNREEIDSARVLLRAITLDPSITNYIVRMVEATREHADLTLGASPRAALNLALAAKLNAALGGRNYVIPDDVKEMSTNVLAHRLVLEPEHYQTDMTVEKLLGELLTQVPVPDRAVQ